MNVKTMKTVFMAALFVAGAVLCGFTQDVSKKKEIAVFNLSYYKWTIPPGALGRIDEQIRSVFINLGRFSVIGMTYRLGEDDVNEFIEKIKQFKADTTTIPEQVQMGKEFFTQADMNRLIGSFIVVIPSVSSFTTERNKKGEYTVVIQTSFTFINVETIRTMAQFFVETKGTDMSSGKAVQEAIDAIPAQLTFQIRKVPEFQLKTGILETQGTEVILELGRNMGVMVGDEYLILVPRVLSSGKEITEEKGLLLVRQVDEEVSYASVVYSSGAPEIGEQLKELPRLGIDSTPYGRVAVAPFGSVLAGLRTSLSRGFYAFRPFAEIETAFNLWGGRLNVLPANVSLGAEYNLYLGRLALAPAVSAGIGMDVPLTQSPVPQITHIGATARVAATYLFTRDLKAVVEFGGLYWLSFNALRPSYGGIFAGGGLSIKF